MTQPSKNDAPIEVMDVLREQNYNSSIDFALKALYAKFARACAVVLRVNSIAAYV